MRNQFKSLCDVAEGSYSLCQKLTDQSVLIEYITTKIWVELSSYYCYIFEYVQT